MKLLGNDLLVFRDGVAIACCRTCSVEVGTDMIEVSSPRTGSYEEFIAGRSSWTVDVGYLVSDGSDLGELLLSGQEYTLRFQKRDGTGLVEGSALLKKVKIQGNVGHLTTGSFSFQGNGELSAVVAAVSE